MINVLQDHFENIWIFFQDLAYDLVIVDVSNPAAPTLKGSHNTSGYPYGVARAGNYAYMANGEGGLEIFRVDIADIVSQYAGSDGIVQRDEAIIAVIDYFDDLITEEETLQVVRAYCLAITANSLPRSSHAGARYSF